MARSLRIGDRSGRRSASKRATELAERQFGSVARWQMLAMSFTPARIRSWIRSGRLHPKYPGVYALGRPELSTPGQLSAGLLYAGPGAALGGISALWWMGLLQRPPDLIYIDAPGRRCSRAGLSIRHPGDVRRLGVRDLPVVELPQALLASTDALSHNSLRLVLARAEFRHQLSLPELNAALGMGRSGTSALRVALGAHLPQLARCQSPLEVDFVLLCERFRVEMPEPNPRIGRWRPDMLWRTRGLIVELDGKDAHTTPAQIAADQRREAELRRMGYTVVRYTWAQVHFDAEAVAADLRALLGR